MTIDLGAPSNKPPGAIASTIGAFGVAVVGVVPVQRWQFSGRAGVVSMDGRRDDVPTKRSAQGMVALGAAFKAFRKLSVGLETAVSRVRFSRPADGDTGVTWTGVSATYFF
jgi:hypothetical protein